MKYKEACKYLVATAITTGNGEMLKAVKVIMDMVEKLNKDNREEKTC